VRPEDCDAKHPLLWPIRPIAKLFCDAYQLSPYSKLGAFGLFLLNCGLLFGSYVFTHELSNLTQDLLYKVIGEQLPKQAVLIAAGWLAQLIVSNSTFFLVRFVLAKLVYAVYELGRDVVFAVLILLFSTVLLWLSGAYYFSGEKIDEFIRLHRILILGFLISWVITSWYWARYIYRSKENKHVFDHEVGAALVQLTS
jgi:hypothetical protein